LLQEHSPLPLDQIIFGNCLTPIIAVTAHVMAENREKAYKSGCDLFLTKPVKKADLISTIQDFCS
jgi:CheY-like chemotaxis protein